MPLPAAPAVFRGVSCRRFPSGVPQPFWLQLPVLLLRWSYLDGFEVSWVRRLVFYLVSRSSSGACGWRCFPCCRLTLGVTAFSDTVCLPYCCAGGVGWEATLPFCCQCFSCTGWLARVHWVLHPVSGCSHRRCDCPLDDSVLVLFDSTCLLGFVCCSVVSSYGSRLLWGLCGSLLAFPCLRVGVLLACGVYGASSLRVCSLGCPSWLVLLFMSLLSFTCACGGMVWSQVCGPSCCSCVLGSYGVSVAPFCRLGLWSHPLLLLFLAGFLPLAFVRTWFGRLRSCLGSCLLLGGNSPSLVLVVFAWQFLLCGCPGSLSFFLNSFLGFFPLASSFY